MARETGFVPEGDSAFWKRVARAEFAEWRCYVAFVDREPAAHAALYVREHVGAFGFGATKEPFRGRGCQIALLRRRMADATAAGCDLVISQADPGSTSQRNIADRRSRDPWRDTAIPAVWSASDFVWLTPRRFGRRNKRSTLSTNCCKIMDEDER